MSPHHLPDEPRPEGMPPPTYPPPPAMLTTGTGTGTGNGNVLRTELRGLDADVREIKERLAKIEERLTDVAIALAALPARYAPADLVGDLRSRIDRATGGVQFVWLALGLLVAVSGVLLTAKSKGL